MPYQNSGHARKRWRVTFRLPILVHQHTQRPIELLSNEYSYTVLGHDTGVAANRAFKLLREEPELKGAIIRDCFITIKFMEYHTKADEAALSYSLVEPANWDQYMKTEGYKEYDNPPVPEPPATAPEPLCTDCGHPKMDAKFHLDAPGEDWGAALHWFKPPQVATAPGIKWFGRPWNHTLCASAPQVPAPVGELCAHCEKPIQPDDQGVIYVNGPVAHLDCLLDNLGIPKGGGDNAT